MEQQDAEIEMLSQIYFDEFLSDDDATDFDFPKSVGIRLQPRTGDNEEAHVEVTLRVRYDESYSSIYFILVIHTFVLSASLEIILCVPRHAPSLMPKGLVTPSSSC